MASIFGHAMASTALGKTFFPTLANGKLLALAAASACVPDADILAFQFGIPYESVWGHRGASHSILFAGMWGVVLTFIFYQKHPKFWQIALFLFVATLSHPLLDACTTGGRGVALFFPFDNSRIFFPFQKILVSPISPADFFSNWGWQVLRSELLWIGLPSCFIMLTRWAFHLFSNKIGK